MLCNFGAGVVRSAPAAPRRTTQGVGSQGVGSNGVSVSSIGAMGFFKERTPGFLSSSLVVKDRPIGIGMCYFSRKELFAGQQLSIQYLPSSFGGSLFSLLTQVLGQSPLPSCDPSPTLNDPSN